MKKIYTIIVFVAAIAIIAVTLTSGISKEKSDGGGYKDLVEEMYDQAVKQDASLGSIEDAIKNFYKRKEDAIDKYNSFINYNNRYYTDARSKAAGIGDSAAKQKANDIINKSMTAYKTKIADWQTTMAVLAAKEKELNDWYTLLKIMITQPVIEKYQNTGIPDNSKAKEASDYLLKVIENIKAITK